MISYWLAPTATIFAALVAELFAYRNNLRLHEARERLKWVSWMMKRQQQELLRRVQPSRRRFQR
ncbi:hypothetical protein ACWGE0_00775 [Lentzea sp. NPDC054927]